MQARVVASLNGVQVLCVPIADSAGIGRDADNAVQLTQPEVSKHHAVLKHTDAGWLIQDLRSRNGLFVERRKVASARLRNGDCVQIGPYVLVLETEEDGRSCPAKISIDLSDNATTQTISAKR